jgi:purine-nucleoside phosphorylase
LRLEPQGEKALGRTAALEHASAAARWLRANLGTAPDVAVVLGSGISLDRLGRDESEVAYGAVPHWRAGDVQGHPYVLTIKNVESRRWAVLRGRIHEYEGFDLSEVQLPIRSMAAWGTRGLVLTSAGGAVADGLSAGDLLVVDTVLDFQYRDTDSRPAVLSATSAELAQTLGGGPVAVERGLRRGVHASVPGPQYETPAELQVLRQCGVATVSMTPAGELRAALDERMTVAVVTVVTNAGETTHSDVLTAAERAADRFCDILRVVVAGMLK